MAYFYGNSGPSRDGDSDDNQKQVECLSSPNGEHTKYGKYCRHCGKEIGGEPVSNCQQRHSALEGGGTKYCPDCGEKL